MLLLPINQRNSEKEDGQRVGTASSQPGQSMLLGRQMLLEALDSSTFGTPKDMKIVVKNTFIDIQSGKESLDARGSQTATARLSEAAPKLFPEEEGGGQEHAVRDGQARAAEDEQRALEARARGEALTTESPSASSSSAAPWNPVSPPPAYPAPTATGLGVAEKRLPPIPDHNASAMHAGRQVFIEALSFSRGFDDSPGGMRLKVKNTFIDAFMDDKPVDTRRGYETCTARFGGPGLLLVPTPTGGGNTPSVRSFSVNSESGQQEDDLNPPSEAAAAAAAAQGLPSLGSEPHGIVGEDGQLICQPCAWFYKESGCRNAMSCRYCHLCPQGELKNRKKLKIARLRGQEAAAAAAAAGDPDTDVSPEVSPISVQPPPQEQRRPQPHSSGSGCPGQWQVESPQYQQNGPGLQQWVPQGAPMRPPPHAPRIMPCTSVATGMAAPSWRSSTQGSPSASIIVGMAPPRTGMPGWQAGQPGKMIACTSPQRQM
mmetsp:Transcript_50416/g.109502  ORF Transcript_50416/g.109502 Transcript_50416/m.109502 type:complete len:486 (+) Transcript_50416:71-1528(+)